MVTSEWDVEALIILMDIIHGHAREVPRSVNLEILGKFAVLVDYYNCHEVTEVFVELWLADLERSLPTSFGKDSTIWLFVSWVFSRPKIYEAMTQLTLSDCRGPLNTMNLPIPFKLLGRYTYLNFKAPANMSRNRHNREQTRNRNK